MSDPLNAPEAERCSAVSIEGFACTRYAGHGGTAHVTDTGNAVIAWGRNDTKETP